jgi:hypothetical protein
MWGRWVATVAMASMSLTLGACVVEASVEATHGVAVSGPPPKPIEEQRPPQPGPQAVWIAGYWHWTGMQYTWVPGHWEAGRPGERWHAPVYSLRDGTYFYEPGAWQR